MKKLSKELLISGIFALLVIILSLLFIRVGNFNSFYSVHHATDLTSVVAIGTMALANALVLSIICVIIPIVAVFVEFLLTLISRLFNIGHAKKWKNIVSNIAFVLSLIIHFLLIILYVYIIIAIKSDIYLILLFLSLGTFTLMLVIYFQKSLN